MNYKTPIGSLRSRIDGCKDCNLCHGRKNIVFGEGSETATLMIIGEGPGQNEDQQGKPFVGRAGNKLTEWLSSIGITRDEVYITNIVKCRPPLNRQPEPEEIRRCLPYLQSQIFLIKPKLICTLGRPATATMLSNLARDLPMGQLRGKIWKSAGMIVVPVFHPAYILRNPAAQRIVDEDLKVLQRLYKAARQ